MVKEKLDDSFRKGLDKDRRGLFLKIGIALLVVLVLVGIGWLTVASQGKGPVGYHKDLQSVNYTSVKDSTKFTEDKGSYVLSNNKDAKKIEIYEDPACPFCKGLEDSKGEDLLKGVDEGKITLEYKPVNILNDGNRGYSNKVIQLYKEAWNVNRKDFLKFHQFVYTNQPSEGFALTDDQLKDGLKQAGLNQEQADKALSNASNFKEDSNVQENLKSLAAIDGGRVSTPTVIGDGKKVDITKSDWLDQFTK